MAKPTDIHLAEQRLLAIDSLPGMNDDHTPERIPIIIVCSAHAITHALVYVGDCIRARKVDDT